MDTLSNVHSCQFLCPKERYEKDKDGKIVTVNGKIHHVISSSYSISDGEKAKSNHFHSLICPYKEGDLSLTSYCLACYKKIGKNIYYECTKCNHNYHKLCVESPSIFQSSHHPKHPLQLVWLPDNSKFRRISCFFCQRFFGNLFYACFVCDFTIHTICATKPTPFTIENLKRHEHTLHYFPRKSTLVCDVCGLENRIDYLYVCLQCDFIVHKRCVYLPYVIGVSRHNHRLAFTPSIPYKEWTNCQAKINGNYGKYSCIKGCAYAMHTRCALRSDVCDGKELEGKYERSYESKMFKEEGDGIIRYSTHPHHQMRLEKQIQRVHNENKYCQLCMFPFIDDSSVYQCMQCDFILHESCAYNPCLKQFMLHAHLLFLERQVVPNLKKGWFKCEKCDHYSCGFIYVCRKGNCDGFELDTLCASISEPFGYHSHPHPLFVTCDEDRSLKCSICKSRKKQPLNCIECNFVLCFGCATLPHKVRYEHDEHLLTFSYKEGVNHDETYWCEICEEKINPKNGLYTCNECGIALHIECLLGRDPYLRPGQSGIAYYYINCVVANTSLTRDLCNICRRRCPYKVFIKSPYFGDSFCSFYCYSKSVREIPRYIQK